MTRKVVKRSTRRVVGYHFSRKAGGLVPWESQIEQAYFEWLEVDPHVISFQSQPQTFKWHDTKYTPDALVKTHRGSFFVEVKPADVRSDMDVMSRLEDIASRLARDGYELRLVTATEIFDEPLRSNVIQLLREVRRSIPPETIETLQHELSGGAQTFGQLASSLGHEGVSLVRRAIAQGVLEFDLTCVLLDETMLQSYFRS